MRPESAFYTGKGDTGDTGRLGESGRMSKNSLLMEALGAVDEATCAIGVARAAVRSESLCKALPTIQRHLSRLMTHLSAAPAIRARYPGLGNDDRQWLETLLAELGHDLPSLRDFVLPGDSPAGAACHLARAIVRRAERHLVALMDAEPGIGDANLAYLNRLSSFLFVAALCEDRIVTL